MQTMQTQGPTLPCLPIATDRELLNRVLWQSATGLVNRNDFELVRGIPIRMGLNEIERFGEISNNSG